MTLGIPKRMKKKEEISISIVALTVWSEMKI